MQSLLVGIFVEWKMEKEGLILIKREIYENAIFQAICKGSTTIAPDVKAAFEKAIADFYTAKKGN